MTPYQKRYGRPVPDPEAVPNEFVNNILRRGSCRTFNGEPLKPGTLELLVAAAQSAPTSGMLQTWSVIALTTPEEKASIYKKTFFSPNNIQLIGGIDSHNVNAIASSAVVMIWLADLSRLKLILNSIDVDERIREQPTFAEYHLKAIVDATIAAQTFCLAAESMGIEGTYCGAIRQLPMEFFKTTFNLPKHTFPVFGTIHGYPESKQPPLVKARLPSEIVLHRGTYTKMKSTDELQEYNKVHARNISKNVSSFESRVVERLKPTYSKESIGTALRYMGFDFK